MRGHIVSKHSLKIISNFLAGTCCYSSHTADVEEPEVEEKNIEKMPALSISLKTLHESLQEMTQALRLSGGGASGQIRKDVQDGCILADQLWNLKKLQERQFDKTFTLRGHIYAQPDDDDAEEEEVPSKRTKTFKDIIQIGLATRMQVTEWLASLQKSTRPPGEQQLKILRMILNRCWLEAKRFVPAPLT